MLGRKVMIGDQNVDAQRACSRHAINAGDAIVNGDDHVGTLLRCQLDQLGGQAVAVFKAVGHQVLDLRAHGTQAAHADRASRRTITVVIGNNEQTALVFDGIGKQPPGQGQLRHRAGRLHLARR